MVPSFNKRENAPVHTVRWGKLEYRVATMPCYPFKNAKEVVA
jgi:hypothetical protein